MKLLVIGGGGREHALVWKLAQDPRVSAIWCAPGNGGIGMERLLGNGKNVTCESIPAECINDLSWLAIRNKVDLTIVGPDNPLALAIVDRFQQTGAPIFGPKRSAARFEFSKCYTQKFAEKHGIAIAPGECFTDSARAKAYAAGLKGKCVVKADGLAFGKGAFPCDSIKEAWEAIDILMVNGEHGIAGKSIVIQDLLLGKEASFHAICDGKTVKLFPTSKDHKRLLDGNKGPMTGGMGAYSPYPFVDDTILEKFNRNILLPWQKGCVAEGIDYRGILYPGVMITPEGEPILLEFNARFGDPETQVYLTRLHSNLLDLLFASVLGTLHKVELAFEPFFSVCVVMASPGYPGPYDKDKGISGIEEAEKVPNLKVFHAGTVCENGKCLTNGGRVLGVTGFGKDLKTAIATAYEGVERINFEGGVHYRKDIGLKVD